jgi:sialic acid synthase SpsE
MNQNTTPKEAAKPKATNAEEETVYRVAMTVHATWEQLEELKNYMKEKGIKYV